MLYNMFYGILRYMVYLCNRIWPKKGNYIFLRASFQYPDNIQAVVDEMLKRELNEKYLIYCAGYGFDRYKAEKNLIVLGDSYIKGILAYFKCKYVIWDSAIFFNIPYLKNQISINLWHGISLKKIGFYENNKRQYRMSTYGVTYSELFQDKMSYAFGIPKEYVITTGEPRNDYLFDCASDLVLQSLGIPLNEEYKYIIWMPTVRQSTYDNAKNGKIYPYGFPFLDSKTMLELNEYCKINKVVLILKWHGLQVVPGRNPNDYSNLFFLTTDMLAQINTALYNIVAKCDALITDYSSIYVNYMVLGRPICFAYDDAEEYIKDRGFMFEDITSIMPGFHAHKFEEILSFIQSISAGQDEFKSQRERMKSVMNKYNDSKNSARLLDFLGLK